MTFIQKAIKKALQSPCTHKISAAAYDAKGELLGFTANMPSVNRKGGGIHAESKAISKWGRRIRTLLILRTNISGQLLPIHPCENCLKQANRYGIAIKTVTDRVRFADYERTGQRNPRSKTSGV